MPTYTKTFTIERRNGCNTDTETIEFTTTAYNKAAANIRSAEKWRELAKNHGPHIRESQWTEITESTENQMTLGPFQV